MHSTNSKKDSSSQSEVPPAKLSKIPLLHHPKSKGAVFSFFLTFSLITLPFVAQASFFSDIVTNLLGTPTVSADNSITADTTLNSQTIPLMEPSITADLKNSKGGQPSVNIVDDQAIEPSTGPMGTDTNISNFASATDKIKIHVVKAGETLKSIAKTENVSVAAIIYANSDIAKTDLTKVGQTLVIIPLNGAMYTVKSGETADSISKKYGVSTANIIEFNVLDKASDIKPGMSIILPGISASDISKSDNVAKAKLAPKIVAPVAPQATDSSSSDQVATENNLQNSSVNEQSTPSNGQVSVNHKYNGYIWPFPLGDGRESQNLHNDNAIDIAAPIGTPIFAIRSGTILIASDHGFGGGYGEYVVLDMDNGAQALYGHMSKVVAVAGQTVNQGDIIGYVGSTGDSTGPHTHLSIRGGSNPYAHVPLGGNSNDF